ncbi:alpha/beta fold hydrolase [Oceanomicrobium pacificus]|uniref:Alpha/beta fold hydrolase n=1 Tax=Oceanomicrobium pacificus TaxID=2692916 RepID=A0A6B0TRL8_9RHOB|nr:alpha/beta hydrolase [Oceanomicrobium pacificus]MXU64455.1 alpha/beta fold hydrolase [Oceanomicrobium pacificus]
MSRFVTPDGIGLHWEEAGEGVPVLCLPGLTRSLEDFDEFTAAVNDRARVIRLTLRGRMGSDHAPDWRSYNIGQETQDVLAFLDHLGLDRVVVVGTSRGGLVAMTLAMVARDKLAGVLLNDVGPEIDRTGLHRIVDYVGHNPPYADHEEAARGMAATFGPAFPDFTHDRWLHFVRRWWRQGPEGLEITYDPKMRDALVEQMQDLPDDIWPVFDALAGIPLAILRGEHSDILSAETFARMQARRPDAIAVTVPDRGHVPVLDEPEALAAFDQLLEQDIV